MDVQEVQIDYLFLDNETCQRCKNTESHLDEVFDQLTSFLPTIGVKPFINKIKIESIEDAKVYQFEKSPTILVNGVDVGFEQRESSCNECGELCGCGDDFECRSWVFDDKEYDVPPKELIANRILQGLFAHNDKVEKKYEVPGNLKTFFSGKEKVKEDKECCDATCCA